MKNESGIIGKNRKKRNCVNWEWKKRRSKSCARWTGKTFWKSADRFEEVLADTKNSLENTEKQFETAKQEIEKPFAKEEELRAKTARLDELNILLNMDKKENEIVGGEPDEGEAVGGRKEKSYER